MRKTKLLFLLTVLLGGATSAWAYSEYTDDSGILWKLENGTARVMDTSGAQGAVYIPEIITYMGKEYTVTNFISSPISFTGNTKITSFRSDCDFTSGVDGFMGCTNLVSVQADKWTTVPLRCFKGCMSLKTASFNSATSISYDAFDACTSLESIACEAVTELGAMAFYHCYKLKKFEGPNVTTIKDLSDYKGEVFADCDKLGYIYLPKYVATDLTRNNRYKPFYGTPDNTIIYINSYTTACDYNVVLCPDGGDRRCPDMRLYEGKDFSPKWNLNFYCKQITYERQMTAGGIYTIFLPYDPPVMDEVKYYKLWKVSDGKFYFSEVSSPTRGMEYVVVCSQDVSNFDAYSPTFSLLITTSLPGGHRVNSTLISYGTYTKRKQAGYYILQPGNKWQKTTAEDGDEVYIPPFRGYIEYTGSTSATEMGTRFGDATGLEAIVTCDEDGTEQWFDLQGRRIDAPRKGMNIVNGKKVFIK